jgi:Ricin-type beta-trefoil lectin domain
MANLFACGKFDDSMSRSVWPNIGSLFLSISTVALVIVAPEEARTDEAFLIKSFHSGRCLDADTRTIGANGTTVQLWECLPFDPQNPRNHENQAWIIEPGAIKNSFSGRCLTVRVGASHFLLDGEPVILFDCDGRGSQGWHEGFNNTFVIGNKCLDADAGTIGRNGTIVQVWGCNGHDNQEWALAPWPLAVNCPLGFPIGPRFLQSYISGPYSHRLGCPMSEEVDHPLGSGRLQAFEHGQM